LTGESSTRELTAYCGIYCGDCLRYRNRFSPLAKQLASSLSEAEFEHYASVHARTCPEYRQYNMLQKLLQTLGTLQCDVPCRPGGGCSNFGCRIVDCCTEHGYEGCWQCDTYRDCDKFSFLEPFCGDTPQRNLDTIKRVGIEDWAKERAPMFHWQHR
jgi:uncharacterized protein DUF3795